ncbi:MAG: acyl-CoA carboxylase subunit beta [Acidimicrobiales bacterium]
MGAWSAELDELRRRIDLVAERGGPEGIARQHRNGKLIVTERIERLVDPGSFEPLGQLRGRSVYSERGELDAFTPLAQVDGFGRIDGRKVVIMAGDFTVRGGSAAGAGGSLGEEPLPQQRAIQWRIPYVRLLDSAGGSVRSFEELGRTYLPDGNVWTQYDVDLLSTVPVVSAVLGSVAGLPALHAALAHFNVMTRDTGQVFPGGPPVVREATGVEISKEDLGGHQVHTRVSGVVDNVADSEDEALAMIGRFLSYLPSSVHELPERHEPRAPVADAVDLDDVVPRNPRATFRPHDLITAVVDEGSFFEIAPGYGKARALGLARIDGYPVGIMANNPMHLGGATDVAAGNKVARLISLCDTFHLPLIDLADEPGLMVGLDSERAGIERAGARLICALIDSRMPWLTFVVRRLYGVGGQAHHRPRGMYRRYAWPSAAWGSMHILGGAAAAYRREIEAAEDPEAKQAEIEDRLLRIASPFRTAEATGQDIIAPSQSRALAVEFVADAQRLLGDQLGPPPNRYRP